MNESIYNSMNQGNQINNGNIVQAFRNFKNMNRVDPQQEVQRLLQSGQMTQAQFNQLQSRAQTLSNLLR